MKKPIGGEFWYSSNIFTNKINELQPCIPFLTGRSALRAILKSIEFGPNDYILLPAYLCPSILQVIKEEVIKFAYYRIDEDFHIDTANLAEKVAYLQPKAIYIINYFGFFEHESTLQYLSELKKLGLVIIEDAVQMIWIRPEENFVGDYIFNSMRKFSAVDLSLAIFPANKLFNKRKRFLPKHFLIINAARLFKTIYIKTGCGPESWYLKLFNKAEQQLDKSSIIAAPSAADTLIMKHLNISFISKRRIENYLYLRQRLEQLNLLKLPIASDRKMQVPLALPILLEQRNDLKNYLAKQQIYCPVHWNLKDLAITEPTSLSLSEKILSLPIDQ